MRVVRVPDACSQPRSSPVIRASRLGPTPICWRLSTTTRLRRTPAIARRRRVSPCIFSTHEQLHWQCQAIAGS